MIGMKFSAKATTPQRSGWGSPSAAQEPRKIPSSRPDPFTIMYLHVLESRDGLEHGARAPRTRRSLRGTWSPSSW